MASRRHSLRAMAGITLIELMIVVAIIGILAAIAYPSYQRYVARTHRDAALACISQEAQFMERFYTTNLTYVTAVDLPCERENSLDRRYRIELDGRPTERAYTLQAVPTPLQIAHDTCGTLKLNQAGVRDAAGPECFR